MRTGFVGSLAGLLGCAALALAQGYPAPYAGYGPAVWMPPPGMMPLPYPAPMHPMPPPMPPGASPFSPPGVRGWPPPPGSIPVSGWIELASATPPETLKKKQPTKAPAKRGSPTTPGKDRVHTTRRLPEAPVPSPPVPSPPVPAPSAVPSAEPYEVAIDPHPGTLLMCELPICTPSLPPHEITHPHDPHRAPPTYQWYGQADYLFWRLKEQNSSDLLAVTDPSGRTSLISASSREFDNYERHGAMLTLGGWINPEHTLALEASSFVLGERTPALARSSDGSTLLNKPFFNTFKGVPDAFVIASPGFPGSVTIDGLSRLWSAEANVRWALVRGSWGHVDGLAGLRYVELEEAVNISAVTTFPGNTGVDRFGTRNRFFGGQLGLEGEINFGAWFVDGWAKIAVGENHELVDIQQEGTGLFANVGNVGRREFDRFTVLPSAGLTTGARITENLRVSAGYSILFLNNAVRPGEHIEGNIAVGPVAPGVGVLSFFERRETQFWAQGAHLGLEFRY